jgi:predicted permease
MTDLRHAVRLLARSPGFTAVAVLTLAVGLGANATVLSWIRGLLLEPLPGVPRQEELLVVSGASRTGDHRSLSIPDARSLDRDQDRARVIAFEVTPMSLTVGQSPERVWGCIASGSFFEVLGVRAALGRTFRPEEDSTPKTHPVAVLAHHFWQDRFEGDPAIVGKTVLLNRLPFTVIGVAPEGFQGAQVGFRPDLWVPLAMQELVIPGGNWVDERGSRWLVGLARLRPGVSREQADAAIQAVSARLGRDWPDSNDGVTYRLFPYWKDPDGPSGFLMPVLAVLAAMAALVLLLACANVANLLLVRALGRRREIAVRSSLGAGHGRLVRQLLAESLVLALPAGLLGVLLALASVRLLAAFVPPLDMPLAPTFRLDAQVLAFTAALTVMTGLLFGLAPAAQAAPSRIAAVLRDESASTLGGRKGRARSFLVAAQVALSCVLLIAAGLFLRSLRRGGEIDTGFATRSALLASLDLFPVGYDEARGRIFYRQAVERLGRLPGVESATVAALLPLGFSSNSTNLRIDGYEPEPREEVVVSFNNVGPAYFETLGIPLKAGRGFDLRDDEHGAPAMVVNETMASRYWPGGNALGGRVHGYGKDFTVVGIARDGKYQSLGEAPRPFFYVPILQVYRSRAVIHLRTAGDPLHLAPALRGEVRRLDPDLPLSAVKSMRQHLRLSLFTQRLAASFLGAFGLLALVLATVGLYSVIRYAVSQRTRELGVRMALGAQPRDVERMVLSEGMRLALAGLAAGLAGAFAVTRFLESQLLGVSATDPLVFAGVALLLAGVCALASWLPARRAAAVDPMAALRSG